MNELREVSTMLFGIGLLMMIVVVIVLGIAPVITRKSLLFGVRIPEKATQGLEVISLKRNYIKVMSIGGILALIILVIQYLLWPEMSLLAILYLPLLLMGLQFIVFVASWKKAIKLKAKNNWVVPMTVTVDTSSAVQREQMWTFSKSWYVISALIVLSLIVLSIIRYPSLPAQIPTHWGFDMQPDAWGDKSLWTVLMMPIINIILIIAMMLGNITIYRMKLQVSAEKPELSYAQHRSYRRMMSKAVGVMTLSVTIFLGALQFLIIGINIVSTTGMVVLTVVMVLACCVPFTYVYFKAGQGGCKLKPDIRNIDEEESSTTLTTNVKFNRGDDKFWKLGMFYYNEDDPAMLVEDRFGTNSGFNYARTSAKVVTALLIVITLAVYIGTTIMFFIR